MPTKVTDKGGSERLRSDIPPVFIGIAVVLLLLVVGAGAFYVYNGGWKTASQQQEDYKHNLLPIMAAKHGDMRPLEAENKLRKERGEPPLELPKERKSSAAENADKLSALRKQLMERGAGQ